jgi:putative NADPH-quinone reductase
MASRILVLLGHPRSDSFCGALAAAYREGAAGAGADADVRPIALGDLVFDPVTPPYGTSRPLEPDLQRLQEAIRWAEHLALVYPNWWGSAPGPFKSALERVLLPGFAFQYHAKGHGWDRLLSGRTGELIVTMDTPPFIYRWMFGAAGDRVMTKRTLDFCGIKPVRVTHVGPVLKSTGPERAKWLQQARSLGTRAAGR